MMINKSNILNYSKLYTLRHQYINLLCKIVILSNMSINDT